MTDELVAGLFVLSLHESTQSKSKKPERVPLKSISVAASVTHIAAQVTITQVYFNDYDTHIEAVYRFPIDEQAAVCGFEAEIGPRKVIGVVKLKEEAKAEHQKALAEGHGSYLLEQASADVFEMQVGNIPPQTRVSICVKYVTKLRWTGDFVGSQSQETSGSLLSFFLPNSIVPRYGTGPSALTNPSGQAVGKASYKLDVEASLQMLSPILSISSRHSIASDISGKSAVVKLNRVDLSKDFELLVKVRDPNIPCAAVEYDEIRNSFALLLSFIPFVDAATINTEMVILVDRSGSMSGEPILQARKTLAAMLAAMPEGVYFNIVGFGSSFEMLFPQSVIRSDANMETALRSVEALEANLGGTILLDPLRAIFASAPQPNCSRQLMVLTDGAVSDSAQVMDCVRAASSSTRVFTFGIGNGVSRELVSGMARAGGGTAEFILNLSRLQEQVVLQFKRALQPAITDLKFDWQGLEAQVFPFIPRPIFHLDPCQVLVFLPNASPQRYSFSLTGRLPSGKEVAFSLPVDLKSPTRGTIVHSLVAREAIRDLEEGASYLHFQHANPAKIKSEIIRLGLSYNLASQYTSFLAIDTRAEPAPSQPKRVDVPQYQAQGRTGAAPLRRVREKQLVDNLRSRATKKLKKTFTPRQLPTPFGFSVATTPEWVTYGDQSKVWSPILSHGFFGPRGLNHLCWLTSAIALVMTITPWREALLHLSINRKLPESPFEPLMVPLAKVIQNWCALCRNRSRDVLTNRRALHTSLFQLSEAFEKAFGMKAGQDQSSLRCVYLIASALSTCLPSRATKAVQMFMVGSEDGDVAQYQAEAVAPSSQYLVLLNPQCALLPALCPQNFSLSAFLALEKFARPVILEHCICLARQNDRLWMFDDNQNGGIGYQGGLVRPELAEGVTQHFQERVPIIVYHKI